MNYLGNFDYCPKLNRKTVEFLEKVITPTSVILETGSGNSTIWFGKRVNRVVSLESDRDWGKRVKNHLKKEGIENVRLYLDKHYDVKELNAVLKEQDLIQYDIVLHDGPTPLLRRWALVWRIVKFVKPGGYLILDDTHRLTCLSFSCPIMKVGTP